MGNIIWAFTLRRFSPGWGGGEHNVHKQFQKNKMPMIWSVRESVTEEMELSRGIMPGYQLEEEEVM